MTRREVFPEANSYNSAGSGFDFNYLKTVLSLLGVVGVATLPVGYAIGVVTMCGLRVFSPCFPNRSYEVPISKAAMRKIRGKLTLPEESDPLSTAAVFDHALLKIPVHEWLFRRWSTFNICTQCVTALWLSYFFGLALHIRTTLPWWLTIILAGRKTRNSFHAAPASRASGC